MLTTEPEPQSTTFLQPCLSPEPIQSEQTEQVCEPIPVSVPVGILTEYEGMEWSPVHTPGAAVDMMNLNPCGIKEYEEIVSKPAPTQPPTPTSSAYAIQFSSLVFAGSVVFGGLF